MRLYNWVKREIYTRENLFLVQERKRKDVQVYRQTIEKKIYLILKVISNSTSVLYRKKNSKKYIVKNIDIKKVFTKLDWL